MSAINNELTRYAGALFQNEPFFASISRFVNKIPSDTLPTMGVSFRGGDFMLQFNRDFVRRCTEPELRHVMIHEFYHIIFNHIQGNRHGGDKTKHLRWNLATDLAINSLIKEFCQFDLSQMKVAQGLLPGVGEFKDMPLNKHSEWYYSQMPEDIEKKFGGGGTLDDHSGWGGEGAGGPDELNEQEIAVRNILSKAVKEADRSNRWGSVPNEIRASLRDFIYGKGVDWHTVLQMFLGKLVKGYRKNSFKVINKKYPYIHPGIKRGHRAKLLLAVDQSGSVHDDLLVTFLKEIDACARIIDIDYLPFDCEAGTIIPVRKGMKTRKERIREGGTDFDAVTKVVNDPRNAGKWDGVLILSDGQAPAPSPSKIMRGWILGETDKLYFSTTETVMNINK